MAKLKKSKEELSQLILISKEFNMKLKKHLLWLEEEYGVRKTKAQCIADLAQIGLNSNREWHESSV